MGKDDKMNTENEIKKENQNWKKKKNEKAPQSTSGSAQYFMYRTTQ